MIAFKTWKWQQRFRLVLAGLAQGTSGAALFLAFCLTAKGYQGEANTSVLLSIALAVLAVLVRP